MAWPHDTRHTDYAGNSVVTSANLNAIQDGILLLLGEKTLISCHAVPEMLTGVPSWEIDSAHPENGWTCASALGVLNFLIEAPVGFELHALSVKYFNAHPSSDVKPNGNLYLVNTELGSDLAAPSLGSSLGDFGAGADITHETWGVRSLGLAANVEVTAGRRLLLVMSCAGASGDCIAGVQVVAYPLTP